MTNYKTRPFTDKLTMPDGIDNTHWNEIAEKVANIARLSTELRCELEELSGLMWMVDYDGDCTITDHDGDHFGINHYDVEDMAEKVSEIEQDFELNEEA